jgi:hypothetical protein
MADQPFIRRRARARGPVLYLDAPTDIPDGTKVDVKFIAVPLTEEQDWTDLTPEQIAELEAKLATIPFEPELDNGR